MPTAQLVAARARYEQLSRQSQAITGAIAEARRLLREAEAREELLRAQAIYLQERLRGFQSRLDSMPPAAAQRTLMGTTGDAARSLRQKLHQITARLNEA